MSSKGITIPRRLTNQVRGGSWHNDLLSGIQRGLFNVSRYSDGCWVIGPCLHIKHRSVLTLHRTSALDVLRWNSMLDRVTNTHCTAPGKKKSLVHANRHNHSYILMYTQTLPSPRLSRNPDFNARQKREATSWQKVNSLRGMGVDYMGQRESKAGRFWQRAGVCSYVFLRKFFQKKTNNSSLTTDSLVKASGASPPCNADAASLLAPMINS